MAENQFSLLRSLCAITLVCIGLACALRADEYTLLGCLLKYPGTGASLFAALGVLVRRTIFYVVIGAIVGLFFSLVM